MIWRGGERAQRAAAASRQKTAFGNAAVGEKAAMKSGCGSRGASERQSAFDEAVQEGKGQNPQYGLELRVLLRALHVAGKLCVVIRAHQLNCPLLQYAAAQRLLAKGGHQPPPLVWNTVEKRKRECEREACVASRGGEACTC